MRYIRLLLITVFLMNCSSDDSSNIDPTDDNPPVGTNVVLESKWSSQTPTFLPQGMVYDKLNRPYMFLAAKTDGLIILNDNGDNAPTEAGRITTDDLRMLDAMNIFQVGNYVYLSLGDFFSPLGSKAGMAIINVSDPSSPIVEDVWESDDIIGGAAIVVVEGNYAYIGAMEFGIYILDISNPSTIVERSNYKPNINYPVEDPEPLQVPNARGMDILGDMLFLCYDAGGIRIIDVSNKDVPDEIAKFHNFESIENTPKAYNNIKINGNLAYCAVDYCGFEIWDLTNIENAELIGWWNPWECQSGSNLWWNSPGHANQMVYDNVNDLIFVNTGRSDLSVLDVSDPTDPKLKQSYGVFDDTEATWGMAAKNNDIYLLYISAGVPLYADWSGIKKLTWSFE